MELSRKHVVDLLDNGVCVDMNWLVVTRHNLGQSVFRKVPAQ